MGLNRWGEQESDQQKTPRRGGGGALGVNYREEERLVSKYVGVMGKEGWALLFAGGVLDCGKQ